MAKVNVKALELPKGKEAKQVLIPGNVYAVTEEKAKILVGKKFAERTKEKVTPKGAKLTKAGKKATEDDLTK